MLGRGRARAKRKRISLPVSPSAKIKTKATPPETGKKRRNSEWMGLIKRGPSREGKN